MPHMIERARACLFTVVVTAVSRFFVLRDLLLRSKSGELPRASNRIISQHRIASGNNQLDAVFVAPTTHPPKAALLLCHGIGERVHYWFAVQDMLAAFGVASLVFDYSGYGRSTGYIQARQLEQDATSAFAFLERQTPALPISILGFSLGTGIATAIIHKVNAHSLILCSSYTSFRDAAQRVGLPRWFARLSPDLWNSQQTLCHCDRPVLILHGEEDELFPVQMARDLHTGCVGPAKLVTFPNMRHDDPYYRPEWTYWSIVAEACCSASQPQDVSSQVSDSF